MRNDKILYNYLKYHSYWYKRIIRGESVSLMIEEMKKEYKLTFSDKIESINNRIELLINMLEIFN